MIRKDDILKMTEKGISVFRYYLPVDFKVGKNFLNPFYKDTKASCNIYYERYGCGTCLLEQIGNRGKCSESVPDGIAEEVQQREPGKEAFFLHDKR